MKVVVLQHNVHPVRQAAGDPAHLRGDHAGGSGAAQAGLPVVHGRPVPRLPLRGAARTVSPGNQSHTRTHTRTHTRVQLLFKLTEGAFHLVARRCERSQREGGKQK